MTYPNERQQEEGLIKEKKRKKMNLILYMLSMEYLWRHLSLPFILCISGESGIVNQICLFLFVPLSVIKSYHRQAGLCQTYTVSQPRYPGLVHL